MVIRMLDKEKIGRLLFAAEQELRNGVVNVPDEDALIVAQTLPLIELARALVSGDVEVDPYDKIEDHPLK